MPKVKVRSYEVEVEVTYAGATFVADETDVYEYVGNPVITFAKRIKSAIDGDATIQAAYSPKVIIQLSDDLKRFEASATFDKNILLIHGITSAEPEDWGAGRRNRELSCMITGYTRSEKGIVSDEEVNLLGDGTADHPGLYEMMEDIKSLLTDNYLSSGGVKYVWRIRPGEIAAEELAAEELKGGVVKAAMPVTGSKWEYWAS